MSKNTVYVRRCRRKKRMLGLGRVEVNLFALPEVIVFIKRSLAKKLKSTRRTEIRDNIEDLLNELGKYEG